MRGRFATTAILGRPPRLRVPDDGVGYLLRGATLYVDSYYASSSQTVPNLGTGGSALDLTLGSTGTADSNDPKWLAYVAADGAYVYCAGSGNYMNVPDLAAYRVLTGDQEFEVWCALDDWTPASGCSLIAHRASNASAVGGLGLEYNSDATLTARWTDSGGTVRTLSTTALTLTDGVQYGIKIALDVDNGAGQAAASFYTSTVGGSWTLHQTVTGAFGTSSVYDYVSGFGFGARPGGTSQPSTEKFYRGIVRNGIDGTVVLDIKTSVITAATSTTFTEQSSNAATVTINRSTAGLKTAVVHGATRGGSVWAFGTDDYMSSNGDQDGLDMAAGDSFTVAWVGREWATPVTGGVLIAKGDSTTGGSYRIRQATTTYGALGDITDASTPKSGASPVSGSSGAFVTYIMVVDRTAQTVTTYQNGIAGTPVDITAVGDLSNAVALTIGRNGTGTAAYQDFTMQAAVVDKGRAWSATQVAAVDAFFQNRTP